MLTEWLGSFGLRGKAGGRELAADSPLTKEPRDADVSKLKGCTTAPLPKGKWGGGLYIGIGDSKRIHVVFRTL